MKHIILLMNQKSKYKRRVYKFQTEINPTSKTTQSKASIWIMLIWSGKPSSVLMI